MGRLNAQIKDANVLVLNPPPIRGLSPEIESVYSDRR